VVSGLLLSSVALLVSGEVGLAIVLFVLGLAAQARVVTVRPVLVVAVFRRTEAVAGLPIFQAIVVAVAIADLPCLVPVP